jgi:hypothetical protein
MKRSRKETLHGHTYVKPSNFGSARDTCGRAREGATDAGVTAVEPCPLAITPLERISNLDEAIDGAARQMRRS